MTDYEGIWEEKKPGQWRKVRGLGARAKKPRAKPQAQQARCCCGELVQPSVAWEVEINYMTCIVFAVTKAKAKWLAVKSYWDAYSRSGSWPHTSVARRPQYDRFPHREAKAYSPEYVRDLC